LRKLLRSQKIATLPELKQALGTTVDTTVFRKLEELSYHSSYSHRGRWCDAFLLGRQNARGCSDDDW